MNRTAPVIPATLFLCAAIVLGGSATEGIYVNAALQFAAAIGIALAVVTRQVYAGGTQRGLVMILSLGFALALVQLVPLPSAAWSRLPGREVMAASYALIGIAPQWWPISMTPGATLGAGLALLPLVAAALIGMRAPRSGLIIMFAVIVVAMIVSTGIGMAQRSTGIESPFYLYRVTNRGEAVGLFANSNHLATLCAISIPAATALFVARRGSTKPDQSWLILGAIVLFALIGVGFSNSLAGFGLSVVALGSIYLLARLPRAGSKTRVTMMALVGAVAALIILGALVLIWGHLSNGLLDPAQEMGRAQLWTTIAKAIRSTMPLGSGLGSFPTVYPQFENAATVTRVFANHAHNDLLELIMEGGVPALALLAAFVLWWVRSALLIWRASSRDAFGEAATVITTIILLHELVDYPLRTAALAVVFGLCCGIMARPRRTVEPDAAPQPGGVHLEA